MSQTPNFVTLYQRYAGLAHRGSFKSQFTKRLAEPDELLQRPGYYQLFQGTPPYWGTKVAFFFPYCIHSDKADSLGALLAKSGISQARMGQILRSDFPNDLIQLRRLVQQIEPHVNWETFGKTLYYWGKQSKLFLLQDYFISVNSN